MNVTVNMHPGLAAMLFVLVAYFVHVVVSWNRPDDPDDGGLS